MNNLSNEKFPFLLGILASLVGHLIFLIFMIVVLERGDARALRPTEVFSVTLEGGEILGGLSQVPKEELDEKKRVLPHTPTETEEPTAEEEKKDEVKLDSPAVVDDPEKLLEEKRKAEEQKKKLAELEKKKEKKAEEERKKKEEEKKLKEEKAKKEQERKLRNKKLQDAIKKASRRYEGESADAGGTGFGAARLGGKGMGGGTLQSVEFIAYQNELKRHIKSGWHTLPGKESMQVQVLLRMLPDGVVQNAEVISSSGNSAFDESAVRAVYRASPVPPPPSQLYQQFREVRITFDSHEFE